MKESPLVLQNIAPTVDVRGIEFKVLLQNILVIADMESEPASVRLRIIGELIKEKQKEKTQINPDQFKSKPIKEL